MIFPTCHLGCAYLRFGTAALKVYSNVIIPFTKCKFNITNVDTKTTFTDSHHLQLFFTYIIKNDSKRNLVKHNTFWKLSRVR